MKLTRDDLYTLEKYSEIRQDFRAQVMAHKKNRLVSIGPSVTLHFEDRLIMQYQIQEMLRVEKIFEAKDIQEELDAYNPLIPDGHNLKATMMIEYDEPEERREALMRLLGIEDRTYVRVGDFEPVYAIADEDLDRQNEAKTSSVHFLRFELTADMIRAAKGGASLIIGIDHPEYTYDTGPVAASIYDSLVGDLSDPD